MQDLYLPLNGINKLEWSEYSLNSISVTELYKLKKGQEVVLIYKSSGFVYKDSAIVCRSIKTNEAELAISGSTWIHKKNIADYGVDWMLVPNEVI